MFKGTFKHFIDAKGRIAIPNKLRQQLEKSDNKEVLILTNGFEDCLAAYPVSEWEKIEQKANQLALSDETAREFKRLFVGPATECVLDKMGRIMIPVNFREYANITKEVIILGTLEKIEIWSKENHALMVQDFKNDKDERVKKLKDIGF